MKENRETFDMLMAQMYEVIEKQHASDLNSYDYHFYQERRYRISEKIEEILPENKKLALKIQRGLYKYNPHESVKWLEESKNIIHDWDGELHKKYLRKAERILRKTDYRRASEIVDDIIR